MEIMQEKAASAAAYVRAIAEKRGRNAEGAEKAVRESATFHQGV